MTISKDGLLSGSPQALNTLVDRVETALATKLTAASATTLAAIDTADATTLTTAIALANANKAKLNDLISKLKTSGVIASS